MLKFTLLFILLSVSSALVCIPFLVTSTVYWICFANVWLVSLLLWACLENWSLVNDVKMTDEILADKKLMQHQVGYLRSRISELSDENENLRRRPRLRLQERSYSR